MSEKFVETDVLVIGAGGAGLRAAIAAKNEGAQVLVAAKGGFPSGCTAVAMGGMLAAFDKKDSTNCHFEDTIRSGENINNPKLVRLLVEQAAERVKDLEFYGTQFEKWDGDYKLFPFSGSSVPRGVLALECYRGGYVKGLVKEVKRLGIKVLDHLMITDLITDKDAVVGAIGLELQRDNIVIIQAKAVVLATGGGGNLYLLTTNPPDITGDGYALAYKTGVELQDMEFVQARICMVYPEKMRGIPPPGDGLVTLGGRFYNGLCERFMRRYHPDKLELVTRAEMAICAQKEIQARRHSLHGGVYGDLSGVPKEELYRFEAFVKSCAAENFDPTWQAYEWMPGVHHFMGGVSINEKCETQLKGLYAAGEVAAGVHGANRLSGNALTETQVFGAIAGKNATQRALSAPATRISSSQINSVKNHVGEILNRDKGANPLEVKSELTQTMSHYVGVLRNKEGLRKATQVLDRIEKDKVSRLYLGGEQSFEKLSKLLEVENLVIVGKLVTSSAMRRKEPCGAHYREDYPPIGKNEY